MKEKIYTIPVLDAFDKGCECPFCTLYEELEKNSLDFTLGPSYMEVDVRGETNELGFCKDHLKQLYKQKNRLGLALILQSHMDKMVRDIDNLAKLNNTSVKKGIFLSKKKSDKPSDMFSYIIEKQDSCYICNKINVTLDRYIDTFFYLWKKDTTFKDKVVNSNGYCLYHFGILYDTSFKHLNQKQLEEFMAVIIPLQLDNLKRVYGDLEWFVNKFDYRFANEPWKNSKDAIPRTLNKLNSIRVD